MQVLCVLLQHATVETFESLFQVYHGILPFLHVKFKTSFWEKLTLALVHGTNAGPHQRVGLWLVKDQIQPLKLTTHSLLDRTKPKTMHLERYQ